MNSDSRSSSPNKFDMKVETSPSEKTLVPAGALSFVDSKSNLEIPTHDTKRNKELHQKFPEIPPEELLIENYVCALGRGAKLIQGRIYITRKRACFYSSILGLTYRITMYFDDIQSIKRKVSVGFIPNAIEIISDSTVFYFCSFLSRDAAYERLITIWKQSNIESFFSTSPLGESKSTVNSRPVSPASIQESSEGTSDESNFPRSTLNASACCHIHPDKSMVVCDETFPTSAKVLWGLLHGDKSSHIVTVDDASKKPCFLDWFLISQRSVKNLEKTPWILAERGDRDSKRKMEKEILEFDDAMVGDCRFLFFDMNVGIQVASSKQMFTVMSSTSSSICIESKTTNSGVPFSSSYSTMIYMCIQEIEGGLCRLLISYKVVFEKDCYSIIKNPVNQAVKSRLPEFYTNLIENLNLHFKISSREPSLYNSSKSTPRLLSSFSLESNSKKNPSPFLNQVIVSSAITDIQGELKKKNSGNDYYWTFLIINSIWFLILAQLHWKLETLSKDLSTLQREFSQMNL